MLKQLNKLGLGDCFIYPGKPKKRYRICQKSAFGLMFEVVGKEDTAPSVDLSYNNHVRYYEEVEVIDRVHILSRIAIRDRKYIPNHYASPGYEPYYFGGGIAYVHYSEKFIGPPGKANSAWKNRIERYADMFYKSTPIPNFDQVLIKDGVHTLIKINRDSGENEVFTLIDKYID